MSDTTKIFTASDYVEFVDLALTELKSKLAGVDTSFDLFFESTPTPKDNAEHITTFLKSITYMAAEVGKDKIVSFDD
jgi:hypothetical protein